MIDNEDEEKMSKIPHKTSYSTTFDSKNMNGLQQNIKN